MNEKTQKGLKTAAKISLIVLLLSIVWQFIAIYQTESQLISPLIPQSTILEINKQIIFTAFIQTVSCIVALIFYFFDKYLVVIIWVALTLIASRFVYLPVD